MLQKSRCSIDWLKNIRTPVCDVSHPFWVSKCFRSGIFQCLHNIHIAIDINLTRKISGWTWLMLIKHSDMPFYWPKFQSSHVISKHVFWKNRQSFFRYKRVILKVLQLGYKLTKMVIKSLKRHIPVNHPVSIIGFTPNLSFASDNRNISPDTNSFIKKVFKLIIIVPIKPSHFHESRIENCLPIKIFNEFLFLSWCKFWLIIIWNFS